MSNIYDRIFKEDIEPIIQVFAEKVLNIDLGRTEEIKDKIQTTWEREGDFLKKLIYDNPAKNCILHIEFHVKDEDLTRWMLLTYSMIHFEFGLPVKQFVIYVGRKKRPKMPNAIIHEHCKYSFRIVNLRDFSYRIFLNSDIPELVILAVLSDFDGVSPEKVIREILTKLYELRGDTANLGKYVQQLEILAKLRNLQPLTVKTIAAMPFIYDLETDIRYKQGLKKGIEKGVEKGFEKAKLDFVEKLLLTGDFTIGQVAELADVPKDFVIQAQKKLIEKAAKKGNGK